MEGSFKGIGVEFAIQRDTIVVIAPVEGRPQRGPGHPGRRPIISADGKNLAGEGGRMRM
ncbi:MAG: hypothetical protein IPP26_10275 [Flavobacteriales bacterium]|nr:hypothetical protein [Flavobacteriales bacterium]